MIENKNSDFSKYLVNEWNKWIKEVEGYRTSTMHKSIPNKISAKVVLFWNSTKKEGDRPTVKIDELTAVKINDRPIAKYADETFENMKSFIGQVIIRLGLQQE